MKSQYSENIQRELNEPEFTNEESIPAPNPTDENGQDPVLDLADAGENQAAARLGAGGAFCARPGGAP
ncbi:MAG: hypothetical protein R2911_04095 [Caldilineaceae bacterium]